MAVWRAKLEGSIVKFKELSASIDTKLKDITDQETRRSTLAASAAANAGTIAIQQGRNIRLLTTVSMFFLPLTYVTSIFGMTNMPTDQSYWMFGVVTAAICVPFFSLVLSLNSKKGFAFWERTVNAVFAMVAGFVASVRAASGKGTAKETKDREHFPAFDASSLAKKAGKEGTAASKTPAGMLRRWRELFHCRREPANEGGHEPSP